MNPAVYRRIIEDPAGHSNEGEHRFIATMFVHFADMGEMIRGYGEDRAMDVVRFLDDYLASMTETIVHHGGALARVSADTRGDKLLVLFGAPVGVENTEERALHCALEMNRRLQELNANSPQSVEQGIGISSGSAFCGNVGSHRRREYTVIGDQVNTAARLMLKAGPAEILVTQDVWFKTHESFLFRGCGPSRLKGKQDAVDVFQLLSARERRLSGASSRRRLVGRIAEYERFRQLVDGVLKSAGLLLTISGEAGVGKSRLIQEFVEHCHDVGMTGASGDCQFYGASVPYLPWAAILRQLADIRSTDAPDASRRKLEERLAEADPELVAWSPLLGTVVGVPIDDNERTISLTPRQRKEKTFAICLELLRARSRRSPTFLVLTDIHWIDPLSRDLLVYLAARVQNDPVLIMAEHRPEFELTESSAEGQGVSIELNPLSRDATIEMLERMLGTKTVSDQLVRLVHAKTQGNPLYVEEMVRALREANHLVWDPFADQYVFARDAGVPDLPGTIQGLIMSRVDRLPEQHRRVLQVASVFGRTFPWDVLQSVLPFPLSEEDLASIMREMAELALIVPDRPSPNQSFAFQHALVREVVYESLSFASRRATHRDIGEELEHAGGFDERCEVLAHHFDSGRVPEKALPYLVMAGDKAKRASANTEAANYYERALAHLRALGSESRPQLLPRLLEDLGDVLSLRGDYAAAVARYQESLDSVDGAMKRARLEGKIGSVFYRQGEPTTGIEHLELGLRYLGIRVPRSRWRVRLSLFRQFLTQAAHSLFPRVFIRERSKNREATLAAIEIYEALSRISFEFDLERTLDAHLRQLNLCETVPGSPEMAQTYSSHGIV